MARPKIIRDWQRPDINRLRDAPVRRPSSIRPAPMTVVIDGEEVKLSAPAALGEVSISEAERDLIVRYILKLEALIDERIGREHRESPPLTSIQVAAVDFEVQGGPPTKRNMGFGLSARAVADKLSEKGLTDEDAIAADTIDEWRKLPAYRSAYIQGLMETYMAASWPRPKSKSGVPAGRT